MTHVTVKRTVVYIQIRSSVQYKDKRGSGDATYDIYLCCPSGLKCVYALYSNNSYIMLKPYYVPGIGT